MPPTVSRLLCLTFAVAALSSPFCYAAEDTAPSLPDSPGQVQATTPQPTAKEISIYGPPRQVPFGNDNVLPNETAPPLSAGQKPLLALRQVVDPENLPSALASAAWSHLIDSSPHYGTNSTAFAQRFGASVVNNASQTLLTAGLFSPIFHDDPRYFVMGRGHSIPKRAIYAASRVIFTRSDDGRQVINLPLLCGYMGAAAMNNLYFPDKDRGVANTFQNYPTSLVGAAVGFETHEFISDAMRLFHRHKK